MALVIHSRVSPVELHHFLGRYPDLIVVSRDGTFHKHVAMLSAEYRERTGGSLALVTKKVSDALRLAGVEPPETIVAAEESASAPRPIMPPDPRWRVTSTSFGTATVTDGVRGGYVPMSDHPNPAMFRCYCCGSLGPWNGVRCMTCGAMDDGD